MKVGDLVRAKHWENHIIGLVVSVRPTGICKVMLVDGSGYKFDQLIQDMEVICE